MAKVNTVKGVFCPDCGEFIYEHKITADTAYECDDCGVIYSDREEAETCHPDEDEEE